MAAQAVQDALVKAQNELKVLTVEKEALETSHSATLNELEEKLSAHEAKVAGVAALEQELGDLKKEREETANKLSELEVEILEVKESQEIAEEAKAQALVKMTTLEKELAKATAATQQALDDAAAKDSEHLQRATDTQNAYDKKLEAIANEQTVVVAHLETLKQELAASQAAHKQAEADAQALSKDHGLALEEAEKLHLIKQGELTEKIKQTSEELEVRIITISNGDI